MKLSTLLIAMSLPVMTGIACAYYERLTTQTQLTMSQYMLVSSLLYTIPLALYCLLRGELTWQPIRRALVSHGGTFALYSVLGIAISAGWWYCTRVSGVTLSAMFESSYPVFVLLFSVFINRHVTTWREVVAVLLVLVAVVLVAGQQPGTASSAGP